MYNKSLLWSLFFVFISCSDKAKVITVENTSACQPGAYRVKGICQAVALNISANNVSFLYQSSGKGVGKIQGLSAQDSGDFIFAETNYGAGTPLEPSQVNANILRYTTQGTEVFSKLQFTSAAWNHIYALTNASTTSVAFMGDTYGTIAVGDTNAGKADAVAGLVNSTTGDFISRQLWATSESEWIANAVTDGDYIYVVGSTNGTLADISFGHRDIFVAKLKNDLSAVVWQRQLGTVENDDAINIAVSANGVFIGATQTKYLQSAADVKTNSLVLYKLSKDNGTNIWENPKTVSSEIIDNWGGLALDTQGNITLITQATNATNPKLANIDIVAQKLSGESGEKIWGPIFLGTTKDDLVTDVATLNDRVFVLGTTYGSFEGFTQAGLGDVFVSELDNSVGTFISTVQFGTVLADMSSKISVNATSGIYVSGDTEGNIIRKNSGIINAFIAKVTF